jgi:hypothetical protein
VEATKKNPYARQMVVSLLVGVLIVLATIAVVTARLGANGGVERERREDNSGSGSDNSGRGSFDEGAVVHFAAGRGAVRP